MNNIEAILKVCSIGSGHFNLCALLFLILVALVFAIIFLIVMTYTFVKWSIDIRKIKGLINTSAFDELIIYYNKILSRKNISNIYRAAILSDKASILHLVGRHSECFQIMDNLQSYIDKKGNKKIKQLYYNNYLSYLLENNRFDEAKKLYEDKSNLLNEALRWKPGKITVQSTISEYEVVLGNAQKGKKELIEILPQIKNKFNVSTTEYFIALADIKLGNKNEAIERLKKIWPSTKGTYLHDKITGMIK